MNHGPVLQPANGTTATALSTTILVCDADAAFVTWLGEILRSVDLHPVAVHNGAELDGIAEKLGPACVFLGQRIHGGSTQSALKALTASHPHVPVILTASETDVEAAVEAIKFGAFDYLLKPVAEKRLLDAVWRAIEHGSQQRQLIREVDDVRSRLLTLTGREREVFDLIALGMLSKSVAGRLGISPKTVEAHRSKIMAKMRSENIASLVRMYMLATMPSRSRAIQGF